MNTNKKTHGGQRKGAGRKALYDQRMIKITITLPRAYLDALCDLGNGNVSLGVRRLCEKADIAYSTPPSQSP